MAFLKEIGGAMDPSGNPYLDFRMVLCCMGLRPDIQAGQEVGIAQTIFAEDRLRGAGKVC